MEESMCKRNDVPDALKWDLSHLYKTEQDYLNDIQLLGSYAERLAAFKGCLNDPDRIVSCLELYDQYLGLKSVLLSYVQLSLSVDYTNEESLERDSAFNGTVNTLDSALSFIETELAACEPDILISAADKSAGISNYLKNVLRRKPHILSPEVERVIAAYGETMNAPYTFYEQMKLADITFDPFTVEGKQYPLSYSLYEESYEYDTRNDVRRNAFHTFSAAIRKYENATACAYNMEVRRQKLEADLRGYDSVFDYLLFEQHVTREMYDRQIDMIMTKLSVHMRKYAHLVQKACGIEKMTYADLKAPIDPDYDDTVTMETAKAQVREALSILGEDYLQEVDRMFNEHRIDYAHNIGKSTGGFCDSPYRKGSYILMTWNNRMSDAFTLAHELGHAGHFAACNEAQRYLDTDVSTYFVEAPSTMNELIYGHYMLSKAKDLRLRRYILSRMIGDTYYHNCVTHLIEAAYQREVYRVIDQGGSVHASSLNRIMGNVLREFWGPDVEIDEDAEHTWMRQPHYYMGLYSYTYSAGLTVATQVSKRILKEGAPAVRDWKNVLRAGSTLDPAGLAALAGVDITNSRALADTIDTIGSMIDEIERLTIEIESGR